MTAATSSEPAVEADIDAQPSRGPLTRYLPGLTVLVASSAMLIASGVSAWDLLRYGGYALWGVLLPGVLVYRALRPRAHSLVDDLTFGFVVGLALETVAWTVFAAAGQHRLLWVWPAAVVAVFLAVPRLRRCWRGGGGRPVPVAWAWAVAAMMLFLVGYLAAAYVQAQHVGPRWIFVDLPFLLSLVADAKHHFPIHVPQVAGEVLHYHWFGLAHLATGSLISGVATPEVFFGPGLPLLSAVAVALLAVAGWRISGRPWVGVLGTALTFTVGELTLGYAPYLGDNVRFISWISATVPYSWLSGIALMALLVERIRAGRLAGPGAAGSWLLLGGLALHAAGGKASTIPVLICGLGLAGLVRWVRERRLPRPELACLGVLAAAYVLAAIVLYRVGSGEIMLSPLHAFRPLTRAAQSPEWLTPAMVLVLALGGWALFMLPRLAGIGLLVGRGYAWSATEWLLLGTFVGGTSATLLLGHASWAQQYFLRSGWPAGALLSAIGVAALVDRTRLSRRWVLICFGAGLGVVAIVGLALYRRRGWVYRLGDGWREMLPIYKTAVVFLAALAVVVALGWVLRRHLPRGARLLTALVVVIGAGLPSLPVDAVETLRSGPIGDETNGNYVGPEELAVAEWVRGNVGQHEVLATNQHCQSGRGEDCWRLQFWFTAFAERRVLVGGWGYGSRSIGDAQRLNIPFGHTPFWDPELLATNDGMFTDPTPERSRELRERYRVRWLFVDRDEGRESPELARFADLRYDSDRYAIYELRETTGAPS